MFPDGELQIAIDHQLHHLCETYSRFPTQHAASFAGVTHQHVDFSRPVISGIYLDILLPIQVEETKSVAEKIPDRMRLSGCDHVIAGLIGL